ADSVEASQRLAATYFDDGKFEQAIRVYRILQARAPGHAKAPAWQQKILLAYDKLNRRDQVVTEMNRLVGEYGPQSGWAKANTAEKGALAEARDLAEASLRELVQDYHQEAIKTKSAATYRLARDIYRQYLDTFPQSESTASMRFYYAEILYALEEWDTAAMEYGKVVEADPKGSQAQRAAYNAILALEKAVDAAKRFGEIILRWPTDSWSQKAAELSLDILNTRQEWQALSDLAQRFLRDSQLCPPGSKFQLETARVAEGARFKYAMQLYEEKKDFALAASEFRAFVARYPKSEYAPKALYDALLIADKGDELDVEIAAGEQLVREYSS